MTFKLLHSQSDQGRAVMQCAAIGQMQTLATHRGERSRREVIIGKANQTELSLP
jgi:hypothetical protein